MLDGMATQEEPPPAAVDAVRLELRALAEASDRTVPELVVEQQNRLPRVDGRGRVVVPASLLPKGRARWRWYLASCLGRLGSPVPRRRQRIGWALFVVLGLV